MRLIGLAVGLAVNLGLRLVQDPYSRVVALLRRAHPGGRTWMTLSGQAGLDGMIANRSLRRKKCRSKP
jgi:hypothetical protein